MHIRSFKPADQDSQLVNVIVDVSESFIEIEAKSEDHIETISSLMKGSIGIAEMDTPIKQNLKVNAVEHNKKKVQIKGNLVNALQLLEAQELLSKLLIEAIKNDKQVDTLLKTTVQSQTQETKNTISDDKRSKSPARMFSGTLALAEDLEQTKATIELINRLVTALNTLKPDQQKECLSALAEELKNKTGNTIVINVGKIQTHQ